MQLSQEGIIKKYRSILKELVLKQELLKKASFRFSMLRLGAIVLLIVGIYFCIPYGNGPVVAALIGGIALFLFGVSKQTDVDNRLNHIEHLIAINNNEIQCIRQSSNVYDDGAKFIDDSHVYSGDLDIFGRHSLYHWINRCKTYEGLHLLASWFNKKPDKTDLLKRRAAIQELEPLQEWRSNLSANLFEIEDGLSYNLKEKLKEQLSIDLSFAEGKLLKWYIIAMPFVWIAMLIFYILNVSGVSSLATGLFLVNLLLVGSYFKKVTEVQNKLAKSTDILSKIAKASDQILSNKWTSEYLLEQIGTHVDGTDNYGAVSILSLHRIVQKLDYRLNLLAGITLNGLLAWDLRQMNALSRWKQNDETDVYQLINLVGNIEALCSLAAWAYNNPTYCYSDITEEHFALKARGTEHPLIPKVQSVENDFEIAQDTYISIITGSNMAGKSTLLRTVGINMILAQAGTRVAAQAWSAPLVKIVTYMRIKDQLEENVSTFKAELNRIKLILDLMESGEKCLFLIDEMLRGTNSKDKLQGSLAITKRLLDRKAYSMIATHDIKLAELEHEVDSGIVNYFFDIDYEDEELVFDYKVKSGICTNFNASFLLRKLGI